MSEKGLYVLNIILNFLLKFGVIYITFVAINTKMHHLKFPLKVIDIRMLNLTNDICAI